MATTETGIVILGGTGYGAGELLRLLVERSDFELVAAVSSSMAGEDIDAAHPHLRGFYERKFEAEVPLERLREFERIVVFSALPHGSSGKAIIELLPDLQEHPFAIVVDLSADFRLQDLSAHKALYGKAFGDEKLRSSFVYGLPELYKEEISRARFIANPGCLSTASLLSVLPLVEDGFAGSVVFDAKTGSSGAGKAPNAAFHHPHRSGNFEAYKVLQHRHEAEILQGLKDPKGERVESFFVPHLIPTARGIFVTTYFSMDEEVEAAKLSATYREFYSDCPFVRVVSGSPDLHSVIGTNFCDVSVVARGRQVVAMAALDNMVKGMAGQALQNVNLAIGATESRGLWSAACGPI